MKKKKETHTETEMQIEVGLASITMMEAMPGTHVGLGNQGYG